MKRLVASFALLAAAAAVPAFAADVAVSVSVGEPGFYGRLDLGGYPPPAVVYTRPVMIERVPVAPPPLYLRVPPGHIKHWSRHCHEYGACGAPVYFVKDHWYHHEYVPRYRESHERYGRDERRDERHESHERRDHRERGYER